ncbi:MAG: DUF4474 domain-containing protein [Acutalibacteraceae bacterium]
MKSGKKKSAVILSVVLALVLTVQAVAFTAVKIGNQSSVDDGNVQAGVTREVMDAEPESKTQIIDVSSYTEKAQSDSSVDGMKPVTESIVPTDVENVPQDVRVLSEEEYNKLASIAEAKIEEENLDVEEGEVVFIPTTEFATEEQELQHYGLGITYDPNTGLLYGADEHGLLYIGFDFDSNQGIFYNPKDPWQRNFGFCELYDKCAPLTTMFYDTQRFKFDYAGKNWMIQVWKGQYGITSGAEIGVYNKDPSRTIEFYDCASDEDCLKMEFDLMKNGELFFHREDESHWWLTGYAPLTATNASEFEMRAKITCKDEEMAAAFAGALEENNYVLGENYFVDGVVVSFNWQ